MENRAKIATSEAITARAEAIGVAMSVLAAEAGLAPSTAYRWKTGGANSTSLQAVLRVLEARERALLLSLMRLHPDLVERAAA